MRSLFGWGGATLGGALGWWLGAFAGDLAAVLLAALGSGAGLYWGRRLHDGWLG